MIYNEFFENLGECETSFFLGCKNCKECRVMIYNKEVEKEIMERNRREQEMLQELYGDIDFDVDEIDDPYWAQQALDDLQNDLQAKCHEVNILKKALKEIEETDIIETVKSVVNKQIKKNIEEIEKADMIYYDQLTIDTYKNLFEVDLTQMTEEQINSIDLTTYTDCQPW